MNPPLFKKAVLSLKISLIKDIMFLNMMIKKKRRDSHEYEAHLQRRAE